MIIYLFIYNVLFEFTCALNVHINFGEKNQNENSRVHL